MTNERLQQGVDLSEKIVWQKCKVGALIDACKSDKYKVVYADNQMIVVDNTNKSYQDCFFFMRQMLVSMLEKEKKELDKLEKQFESL